MTKTEFILKISVKIRQKSDENEQQYQLGDYWLIQCQVLQTSIIRIFLAGSKENYKLDLGSERVKNGKMINSINTLCACIITPKYVGILPFISSLRSFFFRFLFRMLLNISLFGC